VPRGEAPVAFGRPDMSGLAVYYVSPPEGPNLAAAYLSGFLQTRTPWAQQVFTARLRALDPAERNKRLAELQATRADLLAQLSASDRQRDQSATSISGKETDKFNEILRYRATERTAKATENAAMTGLEAELIKARQVTSDAGRGVVDAMAADVGAARDRVSKAMQSDDPAALEAALTDLRAKANNNARAAANLKPMEREAVNAEVQKILNGIRLGDADLETDMRELVGTAFPQTSVVPVTERGARLPSTSDIAEEANVVGELLGLPSPASRRAGGQSRPAPAGAPEALPASASEPAPAGGQGGETSSSRSMSVSGPYASDADIRKGITGIDLMMARLLSEDPQGALGGFEDPLPGNYRRARGGRKPRRPGKADRADQARELAGSVAAIPMPPAEPTGAPPPASSPPAAAVAPAAEAPPKPKATKPAAKETPDIDERIAELMPPQSEQPITYEMDAKERAEAKAANRSAGRVVPEFVGPPPQDDEPEPEEPEGGGEAPYPTPEQAGRKMPAPARERFVEAENELGLPEGPMRAPAGPRPTWSPRDAARELMGTMSVETPLPNPGDVVNRFGVTKPDAVSRFESGVKSGGQDLARGIVHTTGMLGTDSPLVPNVMETDPALFEANVDRLFSLLGLPPQAEIRRRLGLAGR
jgi:hypothetical protein